MSLSVTAITCQTHYTLTNQDGTPIDSAVFTFDDTNIRLITSTSDVSKAGIFRLSLKATIPGNAVSQTKYFSFYIIDPCSTVPTLSFSEDLVVPLFEFGTADTWTLPEINLGSHPLSEVRFEASSSLQSYFSFDENEGSVYFNGGLQ